MIFTILLFGLSLMVIACSPFVATTGDGPVFFWPGAVIFTGALLWAVL